MAKLIPARTAQYVMQAEFTFNFDDTIVNTSGATVDFGATNLAATTATIINLPDNAVVVGGEMITETAFDAATYNVTIGDTASANRYLGTTDKKSIGRTALVPTGAYNASNVNITFTAADACTTGRATIRVQYVLPGKANEVVPN